MSTNILYRDDEQLRSNDAIYGTNKVRYMPWIHRIIGAERNHSNGKLGELSIKEIGYDLAGKFPDQKLAEVIKASSTELAQANAVPREFKYNKSVLAVEFVMSNLKDANMSNVEAGILNELLKQYDVEGYKGSLGNVGITNNPMLETTNAQASATIDALLAAIAVGQSAMKDALGITDDDFSSVMLGYSSKVSDILKLRSGDITGRKIVSDTYANLDMQEIPKIITNTTEYLEFYYKPMLTLHHGASPSKYNTEETGHGLKKSSLFVYESVGIESESKGAIVRVPLTFA